MENGENVEPLNATMAPNAAPMKPAVQCPRPGSELARIDELIEQLQSGAFSEDLDHPYYKKYLSLFTIKDRRKKAAAKRSEYSRECVLKGYTSLVGQIILEHQMDLMALYKCMNHVESTVVKKSSKWIKQIKRSHAPHRDAFLSSKPEVDNEQLCLDDDLKAIAMSSR